MKTTKFTFRQSWRDAIQDLPDDVRLEIYECAIDYALFGIEKQMTSVAKLAFSFIKQDIDKENESYQKIIDRNRTNGQKGGRPRNPEKPKETQKTQDNPKNPVGKVAKNSVQNTPTEEQKSTVKGISGADKTQNNPNNPFGFSVLGGGLEVKEKERTKEKENIYNNKKNISIDIDIEKENENELFPMMKPPENPEFIKFNLWIDANCPFVRKVKTQMNEAQFVSLKKKYTSREIASALENLNNWAEFPKKRTNVYRSTLDELKRSYGERKSS